MNRSSYIQLTDKSKQQQISLEEVKELLQYYISMLAHTGTQLSWDYVGSAFPYDIQERQHDGETYLFLKGKDAHYYQGISIAVNLESEKSVIQVTLSPESTFADKSKANEFITFMAKKLKGALKLFNERTIPYDIMKV